MTTPATPGPPVKYCTESLYGLPKLNEPETSFVVYKAADVERVDHELERNVLALKEWAVNVYGTDWSGQVYIKAILATLKGRT